MRPDELRADDAPQSMRRQAHAEAHASGEEESESASALIGRSVTVDRPRHELYAFWRDFSNLPRFIGGIRRVEALDASRARWVVGRDEDQAVWETTVLEDQPDQLITWRTTSGSNLLHHGRLEFRDAAGGRGAVVTATLDYDQAGGRIGELLAQIFHRDPRTQAYQALRRFKQLLETGEVATAEPPRAAPRA